MKKMMTAFLLLVLLTGTVGAAQIEFAASYDSALQIAAAKNQDVLITFYADWCSWCHRLDTVTYHQQEVVDLSNEIVFVKVNAEKEIALARKYGVTGYPTIVLTNPDGSEIDCIPGYVEGPEFVSTIRDYMADKNTLADYLRQADTSKSTSLYYRLAGKYAVRGKYAEAETYYRRIFESDRNNEKGYSDSALYSLADMKVNAGKYVQGQYYFRRLRSIYSQSALAPDALMSIAWAKMRMRKFDEAVFTFKKFLKEYPASEAAIDVERYIAYVYEKAGVTKKALRLYRKSLEAHPDSGDVNWVKKRIATIENRKKGN